MRKLVLAALFASSTALAQVAPTQPVGPDNGFFRPTPFNDLSLTRDSALAARQAAELQERLAAEAAMPVVEMPAPPSLVMNPAASAEVETQAAQREAEAERQRAIAQPQPIAGAFTGLTGNENR